MHDEILISVHRLQELQQAGQCLVFDCRFSLTDPEKGREDWLLNHIPGARYAHLDEDLAASVSPESGRHPLPDPAEFAKFLASVGWTPNSLLVAYDDGSNALSARLWWLMRYFDQPAALLDGGFAAWLEAGLPLESGATQVTSVALSDLRSSDSMIVNTHQVEANIEKPEFTILDARAAGRFSGQIEPLDSKGGHIPGAVNRPLQLNLDENGCFKSPDLLRREFSELLGQTEAKDIVHSCGSGVTACHNLFAMEVAGLRDSRVYPGSWSEWIRNPTHPIETGD